MDFRKVEFGKADAKEEGIEYPNLLIVILTIPIF